jgi:aryl-alcohol dehydrogenase-like predicted oxidoreductase
MSFTHSIRKCSSSRAISVFERRRRFDIVKDALALAQPWADVVLSGAVTLEQLMSNLGALRVSLDETAANQFGALEEPAPEYWSKRGQLAWN